MAKLTAKQEAFCVKVAEGKTYSDAYRHAYNCEKMQDNVINVKASELMSNGNISVRVDELKDELCLSSKYDLEAHFRELEELKQLALTPQGDNGRIDMNVATRIAELKGKVTGHYIDRKSIDANVSGSYTVNILVGDD